MKNILFLMRHPPHQGLRLAETLDQLLTAAAFDQSVGVLFLDDGVYQLHPGQQAAALQLKNTAALLPAMQFYGVEEIFVEAESLSERGLDLASPLLPARRMPRAQIAAFLQDFDLIIND